MANGSLTQKVVTIDPPTPASGFSTLYNKSGAYYYIDDAGNVVSLGAPVFGTQAENFIDTTNVSVTTATPFAAYTFTTASKPAGLYRIQLNFHYEPAATGSNDLFTLRVDGSQQGLEYEDEGKDTGGDIRRVVNLLGYYTHGAAGTFDIELYASREGGTQVLHGCQAEVWRVL